MLKSWSPTKKGLMVPNRMILVSSWHCHDEKLGEQKISLAIKPYSLELCGLWHHLVETIFSKSYSLIADKKVALNWWWQSFHRRFRRSKVQSHQTVTFSGCNCLSSITWGASLLKKILLEKLPSTDHHHFCSWFW